MNDSDILASVRSTLGASSESVSRIRLGPGVLGYGAYVSIFALVALAPVAAFGGPLAPWAFGGIMTIFVGFMAFAAWFGAKHPGPALLGGGDLVQWRQLDLAAMNTPAIEDARPVPNPVLPAPEPANAPPE